MTDSKKEKSKAVKISQRSLDQFEKKMAYEKQYSEFYNGLSSDGRAIEAISHLSKAREELVRLSEKANRKIIHQLNIYQDFFQVEKNENDKVRQIYKQIIEMVDKAFPHEFKKIYPEVSEEKLTELASKFCKLKGISNKLEIKRFTDDSDKYKDAYEGLSYTDSIELFTHTLYREKEELEHCLIQREAIESVIETAIYLDYPDELDKQTIKNVSDQKSSNRTPGPDRPEELIFDIKAVLELVLDPDTVLNEKHSEKEDFTDSNGKLVISRIVEYVENYYPPFATRWVDEETAIKEGGYSTRSLKKYFTEVYRNMKSSNSS